MSLVYAREDLTPELWAEATPLLHAHWREVAHFTDIPLEPDYEVYAASQAAGFIRCFTARERSDVQMLDLPNVTWFPQLVGYSLFFVRPHPHYKSCVYAAQDVLYVDKAARGQAAVRFLAFCDQQLAEEGVEVVTQHLKAKHDHARLMDALGYELMDQIYVKRLNVARETLRASA